MNKQDLYQHIKQLEPFLKQVSQYVWQHPEISGQEKLCCQYYLDVLEKHHFKIITKPELPHAFYAQYGHGYPTIALLAEYDALPQLSQQTTTVKKVIKNQDHGHGCGHNLLGAASLTAAIALSKLLESNKISGTIRLYGCPEEETLEGKLKMIAASMFEGCDIALSWHPGDCNMTYDKAYLACTTAYYEFHGQTSHAGFAPEKGRSALDAVELMSVGCNYLREHVVDHTRIHYTTYSGGFPPNIVPDKASAKYCIRAPRMSDVKDTLRRVDLVAQGAAMMSETEVTIHHGFGGYELLENKHLASLNYQNLLEAPAPKYTDEELTFAKQLQQTLPASSLHVYDEYQANQIIFQGVAPRHAWKDHPVYASSDSGDVSYIMPTGLFNTACYPVGCAPHTWQVCSSVGMSIGEKGALYAAQVLAGSAFDLLTNEKIRNDIIDEFTRYNDGTYQTMLPDE